MATPVYKIFLGKMSEAWYARSDDERHRLLDQVNSALQSAGGRRLVICDSAWCSEQYPFFGIEEFPDLAAVQQFHRALDEISWLRYVDCLTALGTKVMGEASDLPLCKGFIGRMTDAWYALPNERQDQVWAQLLAAHQQAGGKILVNCNPWWANSQYHYFGVETWQDIDALHQYAAAQEAMGWPRYVEEIAVLGTR